MAHFVVTLLSQPQAESTRLSNHLRTKVNTYTNGKAKQREACAETTAACQEPGFAQLSTDLSKWKSKGGRSDL